MSRVVLGGVGGGYSGARCVAEDMRFLTLVKRPPDSDGTGEIFAALLTCESEDPTENRLESRWLDFFLSPNIVGRSVWKGHGNDRAPVDDPFD